MGRCLGLAGSIQTHWIGPPGQLSSYSGFSRDPWFRGRIQRTRKIMRTPSEVFGAFLWPRFLDLSPGWMIPGGSEHGMRF
jgi:hypothetical protein